ncbi:MAG: acyl carrier protein [Acidobacteriota bacterium]|jgi:acyl carrier protein|nr:acyl carrier protein [Acidobacteriota bacterium]MDE2711115.1 acyl carrier protein [Acidobacteriota bacterium]MDE2883129.1 acyl carrier protein [Acidobacteriota bacterium]MDE3261317.1 acyl carrier protein [Acidobacteriota bacterium]MXW70652.1 acyl carrier protein [Acidobacteriota bacterium]
MPDKAKEAEGAPEPEELPVDERVRELICEQLSVSPDEVTPEATFVGDLSADSLDMVELMMALEEQFGIDISEDQAERIQTVGDAVAFIEQRIN